MFQSLKDVLRDFTANLRGLRVPFENVHAEVALTDGIVQSMVAVRCIALEQVPRHVALSRLAEGDISLGGIHLLEVANSAETEGAFHFEVLEVPVNEHPIEGGRVGHEERSGPQAFLSLEDPGSKVTHALGGIDSVILHPLVTKLPGGVLLIEAFEKTYGDGFGNEVLGDRLELSVESVRLVSAVEAHVASLSGACAGDEGSKGGHGVIAGDRAGGLDVNGNVEFSVSSHNDSIVS